MNNICYSAIPDEGSALKIDQVNLEFIPAHYLQTNNRVVIIPVPLEDAGFSWN